MKAFPGLPAGYDLCGTLDLAGDRKTFSRMIFCSVLIAVSMIIIGILAGPAVSAAFQGGLAKGLMTVFMTIAGCVVYIFAHEWTHGVFIRMFTGQPAEYGFIKELGIAYAKSSWFFTRNAYIIIALAPVILWGIILAVLMNDVPEEFFWCLYFIQICNVNGASGDFFAAWRVTRMPKGVLVLDQGASMKFFAPVNFTEE